jgi:hypothetical protein
MAARAFSIRLSEGPATADSRREPERGRPRIRGYGDRGRLRTEARLNLKAGPGRMGDRSRAQGARPPVYTAGASVSPSHKCECAIGCPRRREACRAGSGERSQVVGSGLAGVCRGLD